MLTPLATSMLAMLCERPMHCYEMYRLMLARYEDRVVKVKPGSLYHTMDRLHANGLVVATGTDRAGGRPERTTYAITDAGRGAMSDWIKNVVAQPVNEYPRLPVALGEMHNLPRAEAVELLRARIATLQSDLDIDERLIAEAIDRGTAEAWVLDADFLLEMTRAELSWLRTLVDRLESKELEWPSEDKS